jgi:hypothetical protein
MCKIEEDYYRHRPTDISDKVSGKESKSSELFPYTSIAGGIRKFSLQGFQGFIV